jgi:hypothetical protein
MGSGSCCAERRRIVENRTALDVNRIRRNFLRFHAACHIVASPEISVLPALSVKDKIRYLS